MDVLRPSAAGPRAFVLSEQPDHIQTVALDPGFYYTFTLTPSTTGDQVAQLTVTGRRTAEPSRVPERSVNLSCWPLYRPDTGDTHLTLQLMSQRRASDGPQKFVEDAYGVLLTKNPDDDDSHRTASFCVNRDGSVDEAEPDHIMQWRLPIDGEGNTATLSPSTIPTERYPPPH